MLKHHMDNDLLPASKTTVDEIRCLLTKGEEHVVDLDGWNSIKAEEISRGKQLDKIKEKIRDKDEMLSVSKKAHAQ